MSKEFDDAVDQAKKVLGEKAEIPPLKNDTDKFIPVLNALHVNFDVFRIVVETKLLALEDVLSDYKNAMKQNAAVYEREDFGLDGKSKDDAKKIKQAQKIFSDYFADVQAGVDKETKTLDELDKHVIQLKKYKPSPEV